jgi:hypothetical protein
MTRDPLMFRSRRRRHAMLPVDNLMTLSILRQTQFIIIGQFIALDRGYHDCLPSSRTLSLANRTNAVLDCQGHSRFTRLTDRDVWHVNGAVHGTLKVHVR